MTDREKLIELIRDGVPCPDDGNPFEEERCASCRYCADVDCDFLRLADYLLANGVTVQKHGRWVNERELVGGFNSVWGCDCSECGRTIKTDDGKPNYCPNCGARTNGE